MRLPVGPCGVNDGLVVSTHPLHATNPPHVPDADRTSGPGGDLYEHALAPQAIAPAELDAFLESGWFRVGRRLITCETLFWEHDLVPVLWLRKDLRDLRFSASNRRRIRRLQERFTVRTGPAVVDEAHEAVYRAYLSVAPGDRSPTLRDFQGDDDDDLEGRPGSELFETRTLDVWDGDRLVAFHWCDVGEQAVMSLIGAYDPSWGAHSLGLGTLLLEAVWAAEQGYRWLYPGYLLPGLASMSYKARLTPLEALDPLTHSWRPFDAIDPEELPLRRVDRALARLASAVRQHRGDHDPQVETYLWFHLPRRLEGLHGFLTTPRFLRLDGDADAGVLALYDPRTERYRLVHGQRLPHVAVRPDGGRVVIDLWHEEAELGELTWDELVERLRAG